MDPTPGRTAGTAAQALTGRPVRFSASAWPWRATGYLLSGWIPALLWVTGVLVLLVVPAVGLLVLLAGIPLAAVERWRVRLVDPTGIRSPHARLVRPGLWGWLGTRFREPATWRELAYALVFSLGLAWLDAAVALLVPCVLFLVCFPAIVVGVPQYQPDPILGFAAAELPEAFAATAAGLLLLPVVGYLVTGYAVGRAALTRALLAPPDRRLDVELTELTRSRARIMDAMDAQRRRIERDLHDGAQQRLSGLLMTLGMARLHLDGVSTPVSALVDKAYEQAGAALSELRELVYGIHPQVLTDHGLAPAVTELAERSPVPVDVDIDLPRRPPESVEAAVWFIVGEALTNVARHSDARHARVGVRADRRRLVVEISDDGRGGADPTAGTGLVGLADRASVLGGRLTVTSPPGGPTVLRVELPCGS
ncbi:sensor histidine kinase [Plantactinospora solaniradicis]|uniref:histidine kinase n=1 Tax=Plantactinospora solaniradicis TaxID=1723736 RepID=A0ABW1KJK7_9ACTN